MPSELLTSRSTCRAPPRIGTAGLRWTCPRHGSERCSAWTRATSICRGGPAAATFAVKRSSPATGSSATCAREAGTESAAWIRPRGSRSRPAGPSIRPRRGGAGPGATRPCRSRTRGRRAAPSTRRSRARCGPPSRRPGRAGRWRRGRCRRGTRLTRSSMWSGCGCRVPASTSRTPPLLPGSTTSFQGTRFVCFGATQSSSTSMQSLGANVNGTRQYFHGTYFRAMRPFGVPVMPPRRTATRGLQASGKGYAFCAGWSARSVCLHSGPPWLQVRHGCRSST
mmetsp:Transcript_50663/g.144771  ORF Transcript_50663/g.144771 Transcript_50663/m.144771 type:complete len:281 (+) Transcript_50663:356-1198(+)